MRRPLNKSAVEMMMNDGDDDDDIMISFLPDQLVASALHVSGTGAF